MLVKKWRWKGETGSRSEPKGGGEQYGYREFFAILFDIPFLFYRAFYGAGL
jgi:hypothetical protein